MEISDQLTFQEAFEMLEKIAKSLEDPLTSLEKSLELYEQGVLLKQICENKLKAAQEKIEFLRKNPDA